VKANKAFFQHIDKPMRTMADLVRRGRYANEIMALSSPGGAQVKPGEAARQV